MGFINKYTNMLRTHPVKTNLATAAILMTFGDVFAQQLERHHIEENIFLSDGHDPKQEQLLHEPTLRHRLMNMRDYIGRKKKELEEKNRQRRMTSRRPRQPPDAEELVTKVKHQFEKIMTFVTNEVNEIDWVRSATMGTWGVLFFSPGYIWLYKTLDKMFPKKTPITIASRVVLSVLYSIPNNTAFFIYGTTVHHTLDWWKERSLALTELQGQHNNNDSNNNSNNNNKHTALPKYNMHLLITTAKLKIETELITTVKNSAQMWIPINFFSFAVIPSHLRPFSLFFFSIFWNCYLSLVQHRAILLPDEEEEGEFGRY